MNHFTALAHIDTFAVTGMLYKHRLNIGEDGVMVLRDDEKENPVYQDWKSMQSIVGRARKAIKSGEDIGSIWIERLNPGAVTPWANDGPEDFHVFRLPLVTNPGCVEYVQAEIVHMPVGSLWWQNIETWTSSANFGDTPRFHLLFELRKPGTSNDADVPV